VFRITAIVVLLAALSAQTSSGSNRLQIQSLMTAAEFRNAGLNKLSDQELANLNDWLNVFAGQVAKTVSQRNTPDVIESQIDGDFNGWEGETIFKLTNGQIWQQAEYDYEYEYAFQPDITIYKTAAGYKMKVEGMDDQILVKRIK
jgi:hypothetical protein